MATAISRITIALALALAAMAPSTAGASPGDLDPGFSGDGIKRLTG